MTDRRSELEQAIRTNRGEPGPTLVYADWLQANGHPLGELIVLQHELAGADDAAKRARADAIIAGLDLPEPRLATYGWRRGLWEWVRLENSVDWMDNGFDALALAQRVFGAAPCVALEELRIGILRWDYNHDDVPAVLAVAAACPWAPGVTRLHLGDVGEDIDMSHHVIGAVGEAITAAFPNLVSLKLHSGDQTWNAPNTFELAGLALPALRELTIETCALSKSRLQALFDGALPAVERLELWFGSEEGSDVEYDDLAPLLAGDRFPRTRHLGLRNARFAGDIARGLAGTPIAARLESLDLSMGTLDDEPAGVLAAHAASFPALRRLVVNDNFLEEGGLSALRTAFAHAEVISADQKAIEGDWRYVSVGE
ncbi:MAG: TIGR02996 domain-containing protein [Deltaproteobacteria bacterium]|nr:TIGR02996 domain-containing protein [Deltaproteobacteria bacterium]